MADECFLGVTPIPIPPSHTCCTDTNTHTHLFTQVELDFEPLVAVASMLYGASFVAERYSGVRAFLEGGRKGAGKGLEQQAAMKKRKLQGQASLVSLSPSDDASDSEVRRGGRVL